MDTIYRNKTITWSLLIIVSFFFILYYSAVYYVFDVNINTDKTIQTISQYVDKDDWDHAESSYQHFKKQWNTSQYLIELNYGEQDFADFMEAMVNLDKGIIHKEKYETQRNLMLLKSYMENMKKIVPKP